MKTQTTNSENEAPCVELSLVGTSSVNNEAAGVDIGVSCTFSMFDFGSLRLNTVPPLYDRVSTGRAILASGDLKARFKETSHVRAL